MKRSLPGILLFIAILSALSTSCSSSPTIEGNNINDTIEGNNINELNASVDAILTKSKLDGTYDDNEYRHLKPACDFDTMKCLSKFSIAELEKDPERLTESCMIYSMKGRKAKDIIMNYKNAFGKWPKFTSLAEMVKWLDSTENYENHKTLNRLPEFMDYGYRDPIAYCVRKEGITEKKEENYVVVDKCVQDLAGKYIIDLYADHKPDYVNTTFRISSFL